MYGASTGHVTFGMYWEARNPIGLADDRSCLFDRRVGPATGLSGEQDPFWNTVTNWNIETNSFKLILHCTSDINNAVWWQK